MVMKSILKMTRQELAEEALRIKREQKKARTSDALASLKQRYNLAVGLIARMDRMEAERASI